MSPIPVMLADDHTIVREGFRQILDLDRDFTVVGEAEDGRKAVILAQKLRPAVILMDIAMPQLNGLEATRQILKLLPATKILMLSAHSEEAYVANAVEAGAVGFLLKQTSAHDVGQAIRIVMQGDTWFVRIPSSTDRYIRTRTPRPASRSEQLSSREMEVLQLIAEGKANKESAAVLGIGIKTVEKHREHLMRKLGIHDTAGLTRYAIAAGIIESSIQVTVIPDQTAEVVVTPGVKTP
jgi:DNA-binding NarL/FixJ family response regulator